MSTDIPPGIVDKAKDKLHILFSNMRVSNDDFYICIKSCFDFFWNQYYEDRGSWGTQEAFDPKPMEPPEAINIIRQKVMPLLRRAKGCIKNESPYWIDFQLAYNFFEQWFGSNLQPPPDKVLNKVLNSKNSENEPPSNKVLNFEESQHERAYDMNSINTLIETLQKQMNAVPSILLRLDNLEAKVTSLHQQTSKPPQNTPEEDAQQETPAKTPGNIVRERRRLGTFPEIDPFSNSPPVNPRSDMHQQASIDTLLQKISKLENDFKCL
jgi:hypothetical protein